MLFCQDLCRSHDTGLIAIVDGNEHRHQCHECFARADITLQKTVHLSAGAHVFSDFSDDAFLGFCQRERQVVAVKGVEYMTDHGEYVAPVFPPLVARVP